MSANILQHATREELGQLLTEIGRGAWIELRQGEWSDLAAEVVATMTGWDGLHPAQREAMCIMAQRFLQIAMAMEPLSGAPAVEPPLTDDERALSLAVDQFSTVMLIKLLVKARAGARGWNDPACARRIHESLIREAHTIGREVDAANYAMMLWHLRHRGEA